MDLDELIATAAPRTRTVQVCGRGDLAAEKEQLAEQLQRTIMRGSGSIAGDPEATELSQRIVQLEQQMDEFTMNITVRALSRNEWADLVAAHAPTREQSRAGEDVNPKTFPVAALAACSHAPKISQQQAEALAGKLPVGEWQKLWLAVTLLNTAETTTPKLRAATELLEANERSSTTAAPEASLEAPSLGGSGDPSPSTGTTPTAA